ncbi:hypothetical protein QQ008_27310 [Fulvivirgaceae bacterium BMA10]|uniref:Outer membrane protein beta-barrel domain-containing protein n=1 Tax=Splendidivirga corallicola TaxID=3051826 RepID=A0ABT8KWF8_9BACT|nr:hypothetical protein [Fulvivirgaceae bacterium BMA10]
MYRKLLLIPVFCFLLASESFSQKEFDPEGEHNFFDRVYLGGNFNLQFGDVTFVDISPLAGYMITNRFSAGLGATYQYLRWKIFDFSTNVYGGRVFARHNIGQQFFAHAEFESLSLEFFQAGENTREWVPGFFLGGGLFQPIGSRGAGFNITALYNFAHDELKSPYNSPWIFRVGFTL